MSQENVERYRRGIDAFNRRDLDAFLAQGDFERGDFDSAGFRVAHPEIDWRGPKEFPDLAESRFGHEGMREPRGVHRCGGRPGARVLP